MPIQYISAESNYKYHQKEKNNFHHTTIVTLSMVNLLKLR
jgi:hypothetical protein